MSAPRSLSSVWCFRHDGRQVFSDGTFRSANRRPASTASDSLQVSNQSVPWSRQSLCTGGQRWCAGFTAGLAANQCYWACRLPRGLVSLSVACAVGSANALSVGVGVRVGVAGRFVRRFPAWWVRGRRRWRRVCRGVRSRSFVGVPAAVGVAAVVALFVVFVFVAASSHGCREG